jgi:sugar phosphate isomerase/epimerase
VSVPPFRVSLSSGSLYHWPLGRVFALASELDIDGIELVISPECVLRGARFVRTLAIRHGVRLLSLHPPILPLPGWTRLEKLAGELVNWAACLSVPLVTLHTPHVASLASQPGQRYLKLAYGLGRQLQAGGSQLALENRARFFGTTESECLDRPADLLALALEWGAAITFDTAHAGTMSPDILATYAVLCPAVVNIHFSDLTLPGRWPTPVWMETVLQHHQIPGSGTLPLRQLMAKLAVERYSGLVTLELSPMALGLLRTGRARLSLAECVSFVRGHFAQSAGTTFDLTR